MEIEEIPKGNTPEEMKVRGQFIKDFYVQWIIANPEKMIWNENLKDYIYVKFLSINETAERAARRYESTIAVTRLSEVLAKAKKVDEVKPKQKVANQKQFEKMIIMMLENIKLVVGIQRSTKNKIQYCITSILE